MRRAISPFGFLNATQFLGALNDNLYKWVMIFLLLDLLGTENKEAILALSGAIYVLPFLLFSCAAGTFADRWSKSRIIVATKVMEIGVMGLGMIAFWLQSPLLIYLTLFSMSLQSALFSPSKYGIVPELVEPHGLARANGLLTAFTVLSIIIGTVLASSLTDLTGRNFPMIGLLCIAIAVLGTLTSLGIGYTRPCGDRRSISLFPLHEIWSVLRRSRGENYLLEALVGAAFFFFIGAFMQLSIVPYAMDTLGLSDTQGGYLFFCSSMGIAIGAVAAGKICGRFIELGLSPIAGVGLALSLLLLSLFSSSLIAAICLIFAMGLFAGLFLVPFDAFIQVVSPDEHRGQNLAVGNFLGFFAIFSASAALALFSALHLTSEQSFVLVGILCLGVSILYFMRSTDTMVRLVGRWRSRALQEPIKEQPLDGPLLLVYRTEQWKEALPVIAAGGQRYVRFLIEQRPHGRLSWLAKAKFYEEHSIGEAIRAGEQWLRRGYHVAILPRDEQLLEQITGALSAPVLEDVAELDLRLRVVENAAE